MKIVEIPRNVGKEVKIYARFRVKDKKGKVRYFQIHASKSPFSNTFWVKTYVLIDNDLIPLSGWRRVIRYPLTIFYHSNPRLTKLGTYWERIEEFHRLLDAVVDAYKQLIDVTGLKEKLAGFLLSIEMESE